MKKLAVLLFILVSLPTLAFADSAKDALRALKKLEARCSAGVSYRDYAPALGDAKFEVDLYLSSEEAKENEELRKSIDNIMKHYLLAGNVWREKFNSGGRPVSFIYARDTIARDVIYNYPNGTSLLVDDFMQGKIVYIDQAIGLVWETARKNIEEAMPLLAKEKSVTQPETK